MALIGGALDRPPQRTADPMKDPAYLTAMAGRHDALGRQAQLALAQLEKENDEAARKSNLEEQIAARSQYHGDNVAANALKERELNEYRNARLAGSEESRQGRQNAELVNLAQSPAMLSAYGKAAPSVSKALLDEAMRRNGIEPTNLSSSEQKNVYQQFAAQKAGQAPTGTPQAGSTGAAPTSLLAPAAVPGRQEDFINQAKTTGQPYIEGGVVHNQPAGTANMDYNVSTGTWSPKSLVGTINGRPAGEVLAEGAQKTGIAPEAPSAIAALGRLNPANPLAARLTPEVAAAHPEFHGAGSSWEGPSVPPAQPSFSPSSLAGPQPNPTPGGTPAPGPISGAIGPSGITQGPTPTPTPGVPKPIPTPEEIQKRLAQNQQ